MELPWTSKSALLLISEYKKHPLLYDHSQSGYVSKSQRHEAWLAIAQHFFTDVNSVKMKINSLLASFRREYRKIRDKPNCSSSWFAYEHMKFLIRSRRTAASSLPCSKVEPSQQASQLTLHTKIEFDEDSSTFDYEFVDIADQETENENTFEDTLDESILDGSPLGSRSPPSDPTLDDPASHQQQLVLNDRFSPAIIQDQPGHIQPLGVGKKPLTMKRKKPMKEENNDSIGEVQQQQQQSGGGTYQSLTAGAGGSSSSFISDESAVFAQHIANKMRKYTGRTRAMVEHAISNILFEADMGKYDKE